MTKKLTLEMNGRTSTTRGADTDDEWDRGGTSTSWSFGDAYLGGKYDTITVDDSYNVGDVAYLVVAIWSTGDSFGHDDCSNVEVQSVHRYEEDALKSKDLIERSVDRDGDTICLPDGYEIRYRPWNGYFERLEEVRIERCVLRGVS